MKNLFKRLWSKVTKVGNGKDSESNVPVSPDKTVENKTTFFIIIAIFVWVILFTTVVFILDAKAQLSGATDNKVRLVVIESLAGIIGAVVIIIVGRKSKANKN